MSSLTMHSLKTFKSQIDPSYEEFLLYTLSKKKFEYINPKFAKIVNHSISNLETFSLENFFQLVHDNEKENVNNFFEKVHSDVIPKEQIVFRIKLNLEKSTLCRARIVTIASGLSKNHIIGIQFFIELSDGKESQQLLTELMTTLDFSSAVVETDLHGCITYANKKFCEISKYSPSELIGHTHKIVNSGYHPKEFFDNLWKTIKSGEIWKGEIKNRAKDGSIFWLNTTIIPFKHWDNCIYKYVAVRHEITKEKEYQYKLAKQIDVAEKALKSLNEKDQFINQISHEVRNNLGLIMGFSELLLDENMSNRSDYYKIINKASNQTIHLMNNILDIMRLNAKNSQLHLEKISLIETINSAIEISHANIDQKGLELRIRLDKVLPEFVISDKYRLVQIFLNLLSNAVKYTDSGSILLNAKLIDPVEENTVTVLFSVSDTGCGIPEEKLSSLFQDFEQCSPNDLSKGSGLGLALCKKTVELMGGKIWAESSKSGSQFFFQIPFKIPFTLSNKNPNAL